MIYVAILDMIEAQGVIPLRVALPKYFKNKLENTNNEALKNQRAATYSLLGELYSRIYRDTLPEVAEGEYGAPRFKEADLGFSLSHTRGCSVAVINDGGKVGADIEGEIPEDKASKLEKRFTSDLSLPLPSTPQGEITLIPFFMTEKGEIINYAEDGEDIDRVFCPSLFGSCVLKGEDSGRLFYSPTTEALANFSVNSGKTGDFLNRWTCAEALLKLSEKGFSDYKSLQNPQNNRKIFTLEIIFRGERRYSLSVATEG